MKIRCNKHIWLEAKILTFNPGSHRQPPEGIPAGLKGIYYCKGCGKLKEVMFTPNKKQ